MIAESKRWVMRLETERARRAAAADKLAIMMQAAHERADDQRRKEEDRERARLRRLLDLDTAGPTPRIVEKSEAVPKRTRTRGVTLNRAIKQAGRTGVAVSGATISADGSVSLKFALRDDVDIADGGKAEKINRWDEVLKRGPTEITIVKR